VGKRAHAALSTVVPTPKRDDRSILVLGSAGHPKGVTAYAWDALPAGLNVADYDIVILNLQSIIEDKRLEERTESIDLPSVEDFGRLWFSRGAEIIALGHPGLGWGSRGAFFWSPFVLESRRETGSKITAVPAWSWYFDDLKRFFYGFTGRRGPAVDIPDYLTAIRVSGETLDIAFEVVAETRYQTAIALAMRLETYNVAFDQVLGVASQSAYAYWLPPNFDVPSAELVNRILERRFGYELSVAPPAWSKSFALPSHARALVALREAEESVAEAGLLLAEAAAREKSDGRFGALLYDGDHALEPLVREALSVLGAAVDPPAGEGIEDGRLVAPDGAAYMLEIKGLTGAIKVDHIRQLQHWVTQGIADDGWDGRGLLVANTHRTRAPHDRPVAIDPNLEKTALKFDQSIITTSQLFQALADVESGKLTTEAFWAAIATARGRVDLPDAAPSDDDGVSSETPATA